MSSFGGKDYKSEFSCRDFLQRYYSSPSGAAEEEGFTDFHLQHVHEFYKNYSDKWDERTARMLEFGGGPVVVGLVSAAPHVGEIVFAAHTQQERDEINLWKDQKDGAYIWDEHIRDVVNKLEGNVGDDAWKQREALMRSRVSRVIACDITQEYPLEVEEEPFMIISVSLCLEVASPSYTEYMKNVQKLSRLLKPGGYLTMFVVEGESFYMVGEKKWFTLPVTHAQVQEAVEESGLTILVNEHQPAPPEHVQNPTISDYKGTGFIVAQKRVSS